MQIVVYSSKHRELIDIPDLNPTDEKSLWEELARESQLANGSWSKEDIHLVNSGKTRANFVRVGNAYLHKSIKLKRIIHFLDGNKKVDDNAFFYLFNNQYAKIYRKMAAIEVLRYNSQNEYLWKKIHNKVFHIWSMLSFQFDICAYGIDGVKEVIGEPDKNKRICRFCGKLGKKYAHISHAIPEAIGNKLLICAEECDDCNNKLHAVEDNFTHLMDFRRAMYLVAGKDRTECPKIKGRDYTIAPDEDGMPSLYIKQSNIPKGITPDGKTIYKFNHSIPVIDQNIYRALVKMVIDLVPNSRLHHFHKTVEWINGYDKKTVLTGSLPSILYGELPEGNMFRQPILYLFFRKDEDLTIPYCTAMLFTTDVAYQFVVPYVDTDNGKFVYEDELKDIRERLNRYFNINWECQQYFSWWHSDIWNYWLIDVNASNIFIKPDEDPVFLGYKTYTQEEMRLMDANIFTNRDLISYELESFSITQSKDRRQLRELVLQPVDNEHQITMNIVLYLESNQCRYSVSLPIKSNGADDTLYAVFNVGVSNLERINRHNKYITGETFSSLSEVLWHKAARIIDRKLSLLMRHKDLYLLRKLLEQKIVRYSSFEFFFPNGAHIKSNYHSLVE